MAESKDLTEEQIAQRFNDEQLSALDAAYEKNSGLVDLDEAERLSNGVRVAIESGLGKDEYEKIFRKAHLVERTKLSESDPGMDEKERDKIAYKRAFFAITRKFHLEAKDEELQDPSGALIRSLSKVLRFRLRDGHFGDELKSMLMRMRMERAHRRVDWVELQKKRDDADARLEEIKKNKETETLEAEKNGIDAVIPKDADAIARGLDELKAMEERMERMEKFSKEIDDVLKAFEGYSQQGKFNGIDFTDIGQALMTLKDNVNDPRFIVDDSRKSIERSLKAFLIQCKKSLAKDDDDLQEIEKHLNSVSSNLFIFDYALKGVWAPPEPKAKGVKAKMGRALGKVGRVAKKKSPSPTGIENFNVKEAYKEKKEQLVEAMKVKLYSTIPSTRKIIERYVELHKKELSSIDILDEKQLREFYNNNYVENFKKELEKERSKWTTKLEELEEENSRHKRVVASADVYLEKKAVEDLQVGFIKGDKGSVDKKWDYAKTNISEGPEQFARFDSLIALYRKALLKIKDLKLGDAFDNAIDQYFSDVDDLVANMTTKSTDEYSKISTRVEALCDDLKTAGQNIPKERLEAALGSLTDDDGRASLQATFPGLKVEGRGDDIKITVRGVESNFSHAAASAGKTLEYFESADKLPELREAASALGKAVERAGKAAVNESSIMVKKKGGPDAPLIDDPSGTMSIPDKIQALSDYAAVQKSLAQKTGDKAPAPEDQQVYMDNAIRAGRIVEAYKHLLEAVKTFHGLMKNKERQGFMQQLEFAETIGVSLEANGGKLQIAKDKQNPNGQSIQEQFENFSLNDFSLKDAESLQKLFTDDIAAAYLKDAPLDRFKAELDKAKGELGNCASLPDDEVALRVIGTMLAQKNPGMSPKKQRDAAILVMEGDIALLQAKENYKQLSDRAGAEVLAAASMGNIRGLLNFKYEAGGKLVEPFLGLEAHDFENVSKIMRLFDTGILNSKTGFILLAAFESFDGGKGSKVYDDVSEKLKELIAKDIGAEGKLHISGVRNTVEDAFHDQLKAVRPFVTEVFNWHSLNVGEWDTKRYEALTHDFKAIEEEVKRGELKDRDVIEAKVARLKKEAKENGIEDKIDFSAATLTAGFKNSDAFGKVENFGHDLGDVSKRKAIAGGIGAVEGGALGTGKGMWAFGVLGANSLWRLGRTVVGFPIRTLFSPFRSGVWASAKSNAVNNLKEFGGGFGTFGKRIWDSLKTFGGKVSGRVGKEEWKSTTYADRSDVSPAELRKIAEEYRKDAEAKPFKVNEEPFVSMDPYKERVKKALELREGSKKAA